MYVLVAEMNIDTPIVVSNLDREAAIGRAKRLADSSNSPRRVTVYETTDSASGIMAEVFSAQSLTWGRP